MKTLACLTIVSLLVVGPALAADQFAPPDLSIVPSKPVAKKSAPLPLTPSKSQWSADDQDRPAKSFDHIENGPCDGCKLSVKVRQHPLYPNVGPGSSTDERDEPVDPGSVE
jgi:hypothetical protein